MCDLQWSIKWDHFALEHVGCPMLSDSYNRHMPQSLVKKRIHSMKFPGMNDAGITTLL